MTDGLYGEHHPYEAAAKRLTLATTHRALGHVDEADRHARAAYRHLADHFDGERYVDTGATEGESA